MWPGLCGFPQSHPCSHPCPALQPHRPWLARLSATVHPCACSLPLASVLHKPFRLTFPQSASTDNLPKATPRKHTENLRVKVSLPGSTTPKQICQTFFPTSLPSLSLFYSEILESSPPSRAQLKSHFYKGAFLEHCLPFPEQIISSFHWTLI